MQSKYDNQSQWSFLCDRLGKVPLYISNWQVLINFAKAAFMETPGNHLRCKGNFYVWCDNICNFFDECYEFQKTPNITVFLEKRRYFMPNNEKYMRQPFLDMKWASKYVQPEDQISFNNAGFSDILGEICNRLATILRKCIFETEKEKSWYDILRNIYDNFHNIKENGCSLEHQNSANAEFGAHPGRIDHQNQCQNQKKITTIKPTKLTEAAGECVATHSPKPINKSYASITAGSTIDETENNSEIKYIGESKLNIFPVVTLEIIDNKIVLDQDILGKDDYLTLMSTPFSVSALKKENNHGVFITILIIENEVNIIEKLVYTSYSLVTELKSVQFEKKTGSHTIYMDEVTYNLIKNKNGLKYKGEQFIFAKRRTKNFNETIDFVMISSLIEWN